MVETLLKGDLVDPQILLAIRRSFYWKAHAASDGKRNSLITSEDLAALWKVKNMAGAPSAPTLDVDDLLGHGSPVAGRTRRARAASPEK